MPHRSLTAKLCSRFLTLTLTLTHALALTRALKVGSDSRGGSSLQGWLSLLGLAECEARLAANGILTLPAMQNLSADAMKHMGFNLAQRKVLLAALDTSQTEEALRKSGFQGSQRDRIAQAASLASEATELCAFIGHLN